MNSGIVHVINRRTGAIAHLSVAGYTHAQRCGLLDGFLVRLDPVAAEAVASEIRANNETIN
jgi:hypothetical protein